MFDFIQYFNENNINVDQLWDSSHEYIKYFVFYKEDIKWIGIVESSLTLPVFVGEKKNSDILSYSFGFFDTKMAKQFFLSITNYSADDLLWAINFLDELVDNNESNNVLNGIEGIKKYMKWARINNLISN